jgi:hypothetical protein
MAAQGQQWTLAPIVSGFHFSRKQTTELVADEEHVLRISGFSHRLRKRSTGSRRGKSRLQSARARWNLQH